MNKQDARLIARQNLVELPPMFQLRGWETRLCELMKGTSCFALYLAKYPEINIDEWIHFLLSKKQNCFVPKIIDSVDKIMSFSQLSNLNECVVNSYGIREPKNTDAYLLGNERQNLENPIILLPCLGVNDKNIRLGYGAGYYDRLLSQTEFQLARKIGVVLEVNRFDFPSESHDIPLDEIWTVSLAGDL